MQTTKKCRNAFGLPLGRPYEKKIKAFLSNPNSETWDDIAGIIISEKGFSTIWNAVIRFDPTFPNRGRQTDEKGTIIYDWERIPTPLLVLQSIRDFS